MSRYFLVFLLYWTHISVVRGGGSPNRTYNSYNQDVMAPDSYLEHVTVTYRHRNSLGTVKDVEEFGVGI